MIPAGNNMKNTEWAVAIFKDFAIRSLDLQGRFNYGGFDEMNAQMEQFPYMYVVPSDITLSQNLDGKSGFAVMETTFQVVIADKLKSSKDNELQTISDSQEIMLALVAELSTHPYYIANQMKLVNDVIITTSFEADDAIVSKVSADITLAYPFRYQYCNQPVDGIPFYPSITTDIFTSVTQSLCTIIDGCPVIINLQNDILELQEQINEFVFSTKTLISGGAEWSGQGLTFSVSELEYTFTGPILFAGPEDIQLNIGDPTYSRIDAIVVDEAGDITVIQGDPSPDPATPPIPDEQLLVQFIIVGAGATTPSITQEFVYLDNSEWATSTYQTSGLIFGSVSFTATTPTPFQGAFCINSNTDQRTGLRFQRISNFDATQYSVLSLRIWFNVAIPTNRSLQISLFNNATQQGSTVNLMTLGLNRNTLNQWQQILVPITAFGAVTNVNRMQIRMVGGTNNQAVQFAADFIQFQSGVIQPQPQNQIVVQKAGSSIGSRSRINFIDGIGSSVTVQDDVLNDRINITIASTGGGGAGVTGATGPAGATGNQGSTGPQGFTGNQGSTGPQGFTGNQGSTGPQGNQGSTGPQGNQGSTGQSGQSTSYYKYDAKTTITSGDPGSTHLIWNNATQINSTQINISHINADNIDIDVFLALIQPDNFLIIQDDANSNNFQKFKVNGSITIVSNSYIQVPVTLVISGGTGTTNFSNNQKLILAVISQGQAGPQGSTGNQGSTGPQGNTGAQGLTGPQGFTGNQGSTGSQGNTGSQGSTGNQGPIGPTGSIPTGLFLPLAGSTPSSLMQGPIEGNGSITFDIFQRLSPSAVALRMSGSNYLELFNGECNRAVGIRFGSCNPDYWDLWGCSFLTSCPPTLRSKCGDIELSGIDRSQYIFGGDVSGKKQGLYFDHSVKGGGAGTSLTMFQTNNNKDFGIINIRDNRVVIGQGTSLTASKQFEFQLDKCNFIIGSHSETNTNCSSIITGYDHSFGQASNSSLIGGLKNVLYGKNAGSSIIGGCQNKLDGGRYNTIIGSKNSQVYLSYSNTIASGYKSCIYNKSAESFIGGSFKSQINRGTNTAIIASKSSQIYGASTVYNSSILATVGSSVKVNYSSIISAPNSNIGKGYNNFIAGGSGQYNYGYSSAILGGDSNQVGQNQYRAAVIGGFQNIISTNYGTGCNSVIMAGSYNTIGGACNSAIIGGSGQSLYSDNTVLVPMLRIGSPVNDNVSELIVVLNSTANDLHYRDLNTILNGTTGTFSIGGATFSIVGGLITNIEQ